MNIKEAKTEIMHTVKAYTRKNHLGSYSMPMVRQRPVLLIGPPGIGKTAIMEQIAKECGIGLVAYTITHHTRQSAVGLPVVIHKNYQGKEYSVTEYTMSEIIASVYECMEKTGCKEGILFVDEINCVSETLTPTMLQFLQCKTFGTHAVPQGWVIVAAGNPPVYNKSAREFDIVTLDRVKRIDVEADFEVWKEYAYEKGIHPVIISYLNLKKEHFYYVNNTGREKVFVTARGWEDLSEILKNYEEMGIFPDSGLIRQYIQKTEIAEEFAGYYQLYKKYGKDYQIDKILEGSQSTDELEEKKVLAKSAAMDERLVLMGLILSGWADHFKCYAEETRYVNALFDCLSHLKKDLTNGNSLGKYVEQKKHAYQVKKENQLMGESEEILEERIIGFLETCKLETAKRRAADAEKVLDIIREYLEIEKNRREYLVNRIQTVLEHGFVFVESCFGDGTEMMFLMNEMSCSPDAMNFISTFGNERYFAHSSHLKVSKKRQEILAKIERITYE